MSFFFRKIWYVFIRFFGVLLLLLFLFNNLYRKQTTSTKKAHIQTNTDPDHTSILLRTIDYINDISPISVYRNTASNQVCYDYIKLLTAFDYAFVLKWPYLKVASEYNKYEVQIFQSLKMTVWLIFSAVLLACLWGVILGAVASMNCHCLLGRLIMFFSEIGMAIPSFVLAIFIAVTFGFYLTDYINLNTLAAIEKSNNLSGNFDLRSIVLPMTVLSMLPGAIIIRLTSISMQQAMRQQYIFTARIKGLSTAKIIVQHVAKNISGMVLKSITRCIYFIIFNVFFIEYIFDWQGIGWLIIVAIHHSNLALAMGSILLLVVFYLLMRLISALLLPLFQQLGLVPLNWNT